MTGLRWTRPSIGFSKSKPATNGHAVTSQPAGKCCAARKRHGPGNRQASQQRPTRPQLLHTQVACKRQASTFWVGQHSPVLGWLGMTPESVRMCFCDAHSRVCPLGMPAVYSAVVVGFKCCNLNLGSGGGLAGGYSRNVRIIRTCQAKQCKGLATLRVLLVRVIVIGG